MSNLTPRCIQVQLPFNEIPYGYCQCGCGQPAPIAKQNDKRHGHIEGQPVRFIRGHGTRRNPIERFWEKVDKSGPDECWDWAGACGDTGYGQIWDGSRLVPAHRFSWELHYGPIPKSDGYHGTCVCHHCDRRECVNPKHLFLGTQQDNMDDMVAKGRSNKPGGKIGELSPTAKLTEKCVKEIRKRYKQGETVSNLASRYQMSYAGIHKVVSRKSWKHI